MDSVDVARVFAVLATKAEQPACELSLTYTLVGSMIDLGGRHMYILDIRDLFDNPVMCSVTFG